MHFADRIIETCRAKDSRLVVGLDPHWDLIPKSFKADFGVDAVEEIVVAYLCEAIDVTHEVAVAYKPQIAFFEQFGLAGMHAFSRVLDHLRSRDAIVVTDAKRNDIGSTAKAYARAYFGRDAGFPADALTVNAYLGSDGIAPFLGDEDHGIFVLVKTSNPSSGEIQDLPTADGRTVAEHMAARVAAWNEPTIGASGYGNAGAVIGATYPAHMQKLREEMPASLILVPGYGAQGGDEEAVRAAFNADGLGALINSARGILFAAGIETRGFPAVAEAARTARGHIHSLSSR